MSEQTSNPKGYFYSRQLIDELREAWKEDCEELGEDAIWDYSPEVQNADEVHDALQLIANGIISPDVFNTVGWVEELEERFRDLEGTPTILDFLYTSLCGEKEFKPKVYPPEVENNVDTTQYATCESLQRLNRSWKELYCGDDGELRNFIPNAISYTPVEDFVDNLLRGQVPTPEVLLAVAKAFKLYILAAGTLSLEEVFFGPPPKRAGTYAYRSRREQKLRVFHDTLRRESALSPNMTEKALAEEILKNDRLYYPDERPFFSDAETLLRAYRRWKKKSFPDE